MKKIGLLVCLLILALFGGANAQYRYDLLNGFPEASTLKVDSPIVGQFLQLIDEMYTRDSFCRHELKAGQKKSSDLLITDSVNFHYLSEFANRYYLFPLNKVNLQDSALRENAESKKYALFIHFADRNGLKLLSFLERSIQMGYSNRSELQQFLITYLWRNTEFNRGSGNYFFVPLPDLLESPFRDDYLNAIKLFVNRYVRTSRNEVQYMVLANYYTEDFNQFIKKTKSVNTAMAQVGYIPGWVNLYQLQLCIQDFQEKYNWPSDSWLKNTEHKYYLVCGDLSLKVSPLNHILN